MYQTDGIKKYRMIVIITFAVLLMLGIYLGFKFARDDTNDISKEDVTQVDNKQEDSINIYVPPKKQETTDIEVIYKDYYSSCGDTISKTETMYETTMDKVKLSEIAKQEKNKDDYKIEEESNTQIVFSRNIEFNCPNHYLIKLENGIIVVYNVVNTGVNTIHKKIDISQEIIRQEMLEELNIGILVNSEEELNLLIEDIES